MICCLPELEPRKHSFKMSHGVLHAKSVIKVTISHNILPRVSQKCDAARSKCKFELCYLDSAIPSLAC